MHHYLDTDGRLYARSMASAVPIRASAPQALPSPTGNSRPIYLDGRNQTQQLPLHTIIPANHKRFINVTEDMTTEDWNQSYVRSNGFACAFCGSRNTPEIRPSSLGPATLCNRCGLRWRRGKLPQIDEMAMQRNGKLYRPKRLRKQSATVGVEEDEAETTSPPPKESASGEKLSVNYLVN